MRFAAPHPTVQANLEAFAKAVLQITPYPVSTDEMLANVAALEAIMKSVQSKGLQQVIAA
jgi:predicted dehydrogenase